MTIENLNKYFDHTILKPEASEKDVITLCGEAKEYNFFSVCVNSSMVPLVKKELAESEEKVCAVIGFPLGACDTASKIFETEQCVRNGAEEIDMVIHVGALKEGRFDYVKEDIKAVVIAAKGKADVKVILETCLLTDEEIVKACELSEAAGARFVKTSTGFSKGGATKEAVALMRKTVGDRMLVKASGGIRTLEDCIVMIEAGADRIGASASVTIMEDFNK